MKQVYRFTDSGITLVLTCAAAPEQYDALDKEGKQVGYIRLRYGTFRVQCPDVGGEEIFHEHFDDEWFGCFPDNEREIWLLLAIDLINDWIKREKSK